MLLARRLIDEIDCPRNRLAFGDSWDAAREPKPVEVVVGDDHDLGSFAHCLSADLPQGVRDPPEDVFIVAADVDATGCLGV